MGQQNGKNGVYVMTGYIRMSAAQVSKTPGLNVRSAADIANVQRDIAQIKHDIQKSSKVVNEHSEPLAVYHGTRGHFTVFDALKLG